MCVLCGYVVDRREWYVCREKVGVRDREKVRRKDVTCHTGIRSVSPVFYPTSWALARSLLVLSTRCPSSFSPLVLPDMGTGTLECLGGGDDPEEGSDEGMIRE